MELKVFAVIRKPVLMEDEGRYFMEKTFTDRAEAEAWVAAQKGQYFGPGDYLITESASFKSS